MGHCRLNGNSANAVLLLQNAHAEIIPQAMVKELVLSLSSGLGFRFALVYEFGHAPLFSILRKSALDGLAA